MSLISDVNMKNNEGENMKYDIYNLTSKYGNKTILQVPAGDTSNHLLSKGECKIENVTKNIEVKSEKRYK